MTTKGGHLEPLSDPSEAYRASSADLVGAFAEPGALERLVTVPAGTLPGIGALHLRVVEALVHGWDPAQATGRSALVETGAGAPFHAGATATPGMVDAPRRGRRHLGRRRRAGVRVRQLRPATGSGECTSR